MAALDSSGHPQGRGMPIDPSQFQTGGALQSAVAASLLHHREAAAELSVGARVGIYRIVRELGRGGMAIVYLAERADGEYEQRVALKWMRTTQVDRTGETLFLRERQALADLRHPHIARLLDGGRTESGRPWLVMEYIEGERLDTHSRHRGLTVRQRLELFLQVCSAVAFAHAHGLIHRDIKPSNVLVDADGSAKLLDFGIAQLLNQEEDALSSPAYTPGFASPEQRRGAPLTVASDVYQLGRLLAVVLERDTAGREPEPGHTAPDGTRADRASSKPSRFGRADPDLDAILAMACHADPLKRHPTADALAADVRAVIERRPVSARPQRLTYLAARYVQRHPLGVLATATAVAVMVATTILFIARLQHERDAADHQARVATTVLDFVRDDLLAAADPAAAPGQELSVRAALDLASSSAGARFADLAVEHTAIRDTLAALYHALGRLDEAEREARHAVGLADAAGVPDDRRLAARMNLAWVLLGRDRLDEADAVLVQLHETHSKDFGAESREILQIGNAQGVVFNRRGEYERARARHHDVHERAVANLGADDPLTLDAAANLAADLQMLGRQDEALPLMQHLHAAHRDRLGERHPVSLAAAHNLGVLLRHQGKPGEALALLEQALVARRDVLGADHPDTLATANEVATVYQEQKRYADAEPLFRDVLDRRMSLLGEDHLFTRNSMSNLGLLYSLWGRLDQAAPLYEHALAVETRLIGEQHPDTIALIHNIAGLYRKQGRLDQALAMHARALASAESSPDLGPEAWQTALFRAGHAQTLQQAGRHDDADSELAHSVATLERTMGADHPRTRRARQMREELHAARAAAN